MDAFEKDGTLTDENIRGIFSGAGDFNIRVLRCCDVTLYAYAIDGLTSGSVISEYIIKPIAEQLHGNTVQELYSRALEGAVVNSVAKECADAQDAALKLVNGFCVVLFPEAGATAFEAKTPEKRSISGPEMENIPKGPRDGFVETVRTNTSLVRRHLRTPDLRIYETQVGQRSITNVSVLWIEGVTDSNYVHRMCRRLLQIDVDGFLTPAAVEEYITGSRFTAFPLLQYTQRTDRFCAGLLEGRVGVLVDGIPVGYLAPVDIGYLMDSAEDYSRDFVTASVIRVLRYGALLLDLMLPAIYIAMTMFHWDLLPSALEQVIAQGRQNVPFAPMWEILMLLLAFELLQETGVHLPQNIGQSVSIIGGIVVGTVGVEAGLVSSLALITVSISGVCGFVLPNRDFADAIRVWRFALALLASAFGLFGVGIGLMALLLRLAFLKSLGTAYLVPFAPGLLRRRLKTYKFRAKRLYPLDRRKQR